MLFSRLRKHLRLTCRSCSITGDLYFWDALPTFKSWGLAPVYQKESLPKQFRTTFAEPSLKKLRKQYQIRWLKDGLKMVSGSMIVPNVEELKCIYKHEAASITLSITYQVHNAEGRNQTLLDTNVDK